MKIKSNFIFFVSLFSILPVLFAEDNDSIKTDILFLKIQELETEIAELRNKIESQNYLIEKLINESLDNISDNQSKNADELILSQDIKLIGVDDPKSKDQVFNSAISALEEQKYDISYELFNYFVESFEDEEKKRKRLWMFPFPKITSQSSRNTNLRGRERISYFAELIITTRENLFPHTSITELSRNGWEV